MKNKAILCALLFGFSGSLLAAEAFSEPAKQNVKQKTQAAQAKKPASVSLGAKGLKFGMNSLAIARVYDDVFTKHYLPKMRKVGVGPRHEELEAQLDEAKAQLRKSRKFADLPSGLDQTPLRFEYTYRNNESLSEAEVTTKFGQGPDRRSVTFERHFFFFSDKMWKVYDEFKLGKKGPFGSYEEAVTHYTGVFGAKPKKVTAEGAHRQDYDMAVWTVGGTIVRLLDRSSEKRLAVVYVDKNVFDHLDNYRKIKPDDGEGLDKDVAKATTGKVEYKKESPADAYKRKGK
jgi:hypothetical protein